MKKILLALCAALSCSAAQAGMPAVARSVAVEGEVLVRYRSGAAPLPAKQLGAMGLTLKRQLSDGRTQLLRLPAFARMEPTLAQLRADPSIELAEPNFRRFPLATIPNDPLFGDQWGLHSTGQANFLSTDPALATTIGADLNMDQAWDANGDGTADRTGIASVVVAVIDDAVETDHPDLAPNIVQGRDVASDDDNPNPDTSEESHGTSVAGAVGARGNNGIGVAGVSWNSRLMPIRFGFDSASHIEALEFARANGAKIINASFGGPGFSQQELDKIRSLAAEDILYVAAAGNDDSNIDKSQLSYPANYDSDNIVTVASTNRQDNISSFSQYGPITVDVAAPGLQIVTTALNDGYTTNPGISGTSFSAPYIAGVAALIRSHVGGVSFRDMKARLIEGGSTVATGNPKKRTAGGRVNANRALELAAGPSLLIQSVAIRDGGNNVLDPGETVSIDIVVRNLWQNATLATASLTANGATVNSPAQALGSIGTGLTATATFSVTIPAAPAGHRYIPFTLQLSADGGYTAQRPFIEEVGRLADGATVTQAFAARDVDLYDEFHAWHFDVTEPGRTLTFRTSAPADIDILVKRGVAPQYQITVGIDPEDPDAQGFFCTSGTAANCQDPETILGAGPDGNETVTIPNAAVGTYHVVVVNFAQRPEGMNYTLQATTTAGGGTGGGGGGGDGGGGAPAPWLLLVLAIAGLARRRIQSHAA